MHSYTGPSTHYSDLLRLPNDAIKLIAECCAQNELAMLVRSSKQAYMLFQPILWRNPKLSTLPKLIEFTNYAQRPHLNFRDLSNEQTYKQACKARVDLIATVHIRIHATTPDILEASTCVGTLSDLCPTARMSLLLLENNLPCPIELTATFPGVLFFMFTAFNDHKESVTKDLENHRVYKLPSGTEEFAKQSWRKVFRQGLLNDPNVPSRNSDAITKSFVEEMEIIVDKNISFGWGYAHVGARFPSLAHIFWRQSHDMIDKLDKLDRMPIPWIRECIETWTIAELGDEYPRYTFWS